MLYPSSMRIRSREGSVSERAQDIATDSPYLVHPDRDHHSSNQREASPLLYVNGMSMTPERIRETAEKMANTYGRAVYVVPNKKDNSRLTELLHGARSLFSSADGARAEQEAVGHTYSIIRTRLQDDHPVHLFGYSQGSLVLKDALWKLHDELIESKNKAQWDHLASRIRLTTAAAATRNYPPGVAVQENIHAADPIRLVSSSSSTLHELSGYNTSETPSIAVYNNQPDNYIPSPSKAHLLDEYLDNTEHFFIQRLNDHSPRVQARMIFTALSRGDFSDSQADEVMQALVSLFPKEDMRSPLSQPLSAEQVTRREVLSILMAESPDGRFDKFTIDEATFAQMEYIRQLPVSTESTTEQQGLWEHILKLFK